MAKVAGTAGYDKPGLAERFASLRFADVHAPVLRYLPKRPCHILDIGAGSGRDAGHLAARGHRVTAVEPSPELHAAGRLLWRHPRIRWTCDALPGLRPLDRHLKFEAILITGVWNHLTRPERHRAMARIAMLTARGGRIFVTLRHGPAPAGRLMFDVSLREIASQAHGSGLRLLFRTKRNSIQPGNRAAGVTWTHLVLDKR